MQKNHLEYRVTKLEEKERKHDEVIFGKDGILTNHIPHINTSLVRLQARVNILAGINLAVIILYAVINLLSQK